MYLSKLVLNGGNRLVQTELGNVHKLHQQIMHAFPDEHRDTSRHDWNILFRQEPDSEVVLVQSDLEPDWSNLPTHYLSDRVDLPLAVKPFALSADQVMAGRILQFRLRANPSKRDNQTKKTIGLFHSADQLAWLERQSGCCGFQLRGVDLIPSPNVFGSKGSRTAPIRITTVLYQGILEVTEPKSFLNAVQRGIGRGKSYGCGLLSIARFQS